MKQIIIQNAHPKLRIPAKKTLAIVRSVLKSEKCRSTMLRIIFIGDRLIKRLNSQYLHHDYPTDVLAFPLGRNRVLEAEVYVNLDRARQQAKQYGVSFRNEIARLVIHGVLHLLGYHDRTKREKENMRRREDAFLKIFFVS